MVSNNQIGKYISPIGATILSNVFSATANGFGKAFYQPREFTVLQDSYAFTFKDKIIDPNDCYAFILGVLNKIYVKYNWSNKSGWNKIKNEYIKLPIKENKIDWTFIKQINAELEAQHIAELEAQHIAELEAYLKVTGLKNFELTDEEQKAIREYDKVAGGGIKLYNLFSIHNVRGLNKDVLEEGTEFDYITRTSKNQGILQTTGKIDNIEFNEQNTWSLGLLQMTFFYRKRKWYAGQFVRKIVPKFQVTENVALYLTTLLNSKRQYFLQYLVSDIDRIFLDTEISLPLLNQKVDIQYINNFISAIKKIIVKDLVLWNNDKINIIKKITAYSE
ncbi:Conserved hypothetical protein, putative TypeII restriction enzyme [Mycoplasma mycoides subsp. capri LC str. 95010]|uniref:Type I restriction modification DNA specificity domain-containing protein n=1 Tax=Mycoplasma mycoides subsp. capri LC str. 95010 TaxID=862259 RepID=F4MQE9_MYCML|nr:Conserved hypothetical protein, putative TypeII restriction enzyme [Mycoplasma mycoides subsp. capri LC str. 95010]